MSPVYVEGREKTHIMREPFHARSVEGQKYAQGLTLCGEWSGSYKYDFLIVQSHRDRLCGRCRRFWEKKLAKEERC